MTPSGMAVTGGGHEVGVDGDGDLTGNGVAGPRCAAGDDTANGVMPVGADPPVNRPATAVPAPTSATAPTMASQWGARKAPARPIDIV